MTAENPAAFFATPVSAIGVGGTPDQAREMAAELVKHGTMAPEQADAALRLGGYDPQDTDDTRTDGQKAFDQSFPSVAPSEYQVSYIGRLPPATETSAVVEFNSVATTWLSAIGLPPAIGTATIERAMDIGQSTRRMSAPARDLWVREQAALFDRVVGTPERATALRAAAERALQRGGTSFTGGLRQNGSLHDATILMNLALHGERLEVRKSL